MTRSDLSGSTIGFLRFAAILTGIGMMVVGVLADRFGISVGGSFSRNQIICLVMGVLLVFAGILGRRFSGFYRWVALCLLNSIVIIVFLELASVLVIKLFPPESLGLHMRKVQEGHLDVAELSAVNGVYAPFVVWRSNPRQDIESTTVSEEGFRVVPGSSPDPDAYRVFLFGGSAMWGLNLPDSSSIPALLQERLGETMNTPVAVFNFAQPAHSSSQEMIELVIQLRNGNVPDAVVFYDGFNDVWGAYESGGAGGHHSQKVIAARVEGRSDPFNTRGPFMGFLAKTNIGILTASLRATIDPGENAVERLETYRTMGVPVDELSLEIVTTYLGNAAVVEALGKQYGFSCLFVLQPSIWFGAKTMTEFEREILQGRYELLSAGADPAFKDLITTAYGEFESAIADLDGFRSYAGAFDGVQETVYNDCSGANVEPFANALIADMLAREIIQGLPRSR